MVVAKEGVNISCAPSITSGKSSHIPIRRNSKQVQITNSLPIDGINNLLNIHVVNIMDEHLLLRTSASSSTLQLQESQKKRKPRITHESKRKIKSPLKKKLRDRVQKTEMLSSEDGRFMFTIG